MRAAECYERALALFRSLGDPRGVVSALSILAEMGAEHPGAPIVTRDSVAERSISRAEEAVALARSIDWAPGEAYALSALVLCLLSQGQYGAALRAARSALTIADEIDHHQWMIAARVVLANVYFEILAPKLAQAELEQARSLAESLGSPYWSSIIAVLRAWGFLQQGEFERAASLLSPPDNAEEREFDRLRLSALRTEIELALATGKPEEALTIIDRFVEFATSSLPRDLISSYVWLAHGEALRQRGRVDEAERAFQAILDVREAHGLSAATVARPSGASPARPEPRASR